MKKKLTSLSLQITARLSPNLLLSQHIEHNKCFPPLSRQMSSPAFCIVCSFIDWLTALFLFRSVTSVGQLEGVQSLTRMMLNLAHTGQ